ncbi:MAG: 6-phosphogluconolactonase, partial [Candidatus Eisenbacteria bacterium]|nr:6-phosphogluconolactonase [Candidatus Eisenbacteria bacterium]
MSAPRIFDDPSALADAVARAAAGSLAAAQAARGGAHLMLCGGRSPVDAYRRLAADRAV